VPSAYEVVGDCRKFEKHFDRWKLLDSFTTSALPAGKGQIVPAGQESGWAPESVWVGPRVSLGGPLSQSGCASESVLMRYLREKFFASDGNRNPVVQPLQTELLNSCVCNSYRLINCHNY
jgi:hypothetical protein